MEFCGYQHAFMAFEVTAESPEDYAKWINKQLQPAVDPHDNEAIRGKNVFLSSPCAMCHTIQGTEAQATHGPDLTHLASRKKLAAGALDNTADNLTNWITNPQQAKPGTNMPPTTLSPGDLQALVAYLGSLK